MFTIALVNQKGGVGKSTTAVNLSAGLARLGKRVLLVDLDPQGHSTLGLGFQPKLVRTSIYSVLSGASSARAAIFTVSDKLSLLPATIDLAGGEAELAAQPNSHFILKNAMAEFGDDDFDFIIVDSPPQLGFLNINSLAWVREVFIPLQCEFYAMHGLALLMETIDRVKQRLNPALQVSAIIPCQVNPRRALTRDVIAELEKHYPGRVLKSRIRVNVRLAEAPSHGKSIFDYAPDSNGAVDYAALAEEVVNLPPPGAWPVVAAPAAIQVEAPPAAEPVAEAPLPVKVQEPAPARFTDQLSTIEFPMVVERPAESEPVEAAEPVPVRIEPLAALHQSEAHGAGSEPVVEAPAPAPIEPEPIVVAEAPAEVVVEAPAPAPAPAPAAAEPVAAAATSSAPSPATASAPRPGGTYAERMGFKPFVIAKKGAPAEEKPAETGLTHRLLGKLFGRKD